MVRVRHHRYRALRAAAVALYLVLLPIASAAFAQSFGTPGGPYRPDPLQPPNVRPPNARPPQYGVTGMSQTPETVISDVRIVGNRSMSTAKVRSYLRTRPGRAFDPEVVQSDVRTLLSRGQFRDVRTFTENAPSGTVVTFQVFERPTIGHIDFVGNRAVKSKNLLKEADLKIGDALNFYAVDEARRKIEQFYHGRGYLRAQVTVIEGTNPTDEGVAFRIHEGELARVFRVNFVGNQIASGARLKTQVKSKPGVLYVFGGEVEYGKIDEDVQRLTAYYRSLGYFQAKIGRELRFDSSGKWLSLTFVINEGPRYRVRDIRFIGNEQFGDEKLAELTRMTAEQFFHLAEMNADLKALRDLYGSQGYVYADIQADPRFLEQPGQLELVYNIREGEQYRVGEISVEIEGDNPHTRQSVVLNRRGHLQPGDIIDVRAVREWDRRLQASQLFANEPQRGVTPHVKIAAPEWDDPVPATASRPQRGTRRLPAPTIRGQNPDSEPNWFGWSAVDELTRSWPW
jgi:outer membrane protein insertion porin family